MPEGAQGVVRMDQPLVKTEKMPFFFPDAVCTLCLFSLDWSTKDYAGLLFSRDDMHDMSLDVSLAPLELVFA